MSAFDAHRPPDAALIADCVHCGFCLPSCPTYVLDGLETDSPRGRIVLMGDGLTPAGRLSAEVVSHFDSCLGCMACVTACPSGVQYDRLIEATRAQVERNFERPPEDRAWRWLLLAVLTRPALLAAATALVPFARPLDGLLGRFPRLQALLALTPPPRPAPPVPVPVPEVTRPVRARVGMLLGCANRVFFSRVNDATARVLAAEGCEVVVPPEAGCCGALPLHAGFEGDARRRARALIAAFQDCDVVVVNAAGCGSAMKEYVHLLGDEPQWARRAEDFSAKTRDVNEFLAQLSPRAERHPLPVRVAYHDACHLAHAQGIRAEPRELLRAIPGLTLQEPPEWEICCGSAGIYNLLEVETARRLRDRKAENLAGTGAEVVAAANPGCSLQIEAGLRARGTPVPVLHPVEILDASFRAASEAEGRALLGI
ncbi:MAG TPA: heterodisulfide reductase-related iron-sulfur binding cluster [Actinomycetota bacterium]|nr:heterodisulfide reductase-related iron-sulfur binding cluster [Actinomycetota bacterium]